MRNLLYILLFLSCQLLSQTKVLTVEDAVLRQRTSLAPEKMNQLQWIPGTEKYSYIKKTQSRDILMIGNAADTVTEILFASDYFSSRMEEDGLPGMQRFPVMTWKDENTLVFTNGTKPCTYKVNEKTFSYGADLEKTAENIDIEETKRNIAFTKDNNLYVMYNSSERVNISNDSNINIVYGQAAHRNEFGITKGTFWSPNGNYLAFYRMDQSMVTDYPIMDLSEKPAKAKLVKYPMAGMKSHEVTLGIFNLQTKKTTYVKTTGNVEQYLTNISWSPDEKYIYIAVVNRGYTQMLLNKYDVATGDFVKVVFEETDPKYIEPLHPMLFVPKNPFLFIWQSTRDGFNQLYLYDGEGKMKRKLSTGQGDVTEVVGISKNGAKIYYMSNKENPMERQLYSCEIATGKEKKLTNIPGTHTILLNNEDNYFFDQCQSTSIPRLITLNTTKGEVKREMFRAGNPLKNYVLGTIKLFTIPGENNVPLYCRMYLPVDFDSTKKYPCVTYLYNGPHVQLINNTWNAGGDLWFQYMAENGYVIFTLDGRGSGNRGKAFEQAIYKDLGTKEIEDQVRGYDYLTKLSFIDKDRMGIFGWSFGGFMTTSIMTREPGKYKVGVAGGPVIDWRYYEIMYTERYMDTPEENPEGYSKSNVLNYVDSLKGKLLVIHGTSDDVVVWQHSLMFIKKCVEMGKQVDYFVYPGHLHNVLGVDRAHLYNKITEYFKQNL